MYNYTVEHLMGLKLYKRKENVKPAAHTVALLFTFRPQIYCIHYTFQLRCFRSHIVSYDLHLSIIGRFFIANKNVSLSVLNINDVTVDYQEISVSKYRALYMLS